MSEKEVVLRPLSVCISEICSFFNPVKILQYIHSIHSHVANYHVSKSSIKDIISHSYITLLNVWCSNFIFFSFIYKFTFIMKCYCHRFSRYVKLLIQTLLKKHCNFSKSTFSAQFDTFLLKRPLVLHVRIVILFWNSTYIHFLLVFGVHFYRFVKTINLSSTKKHCNFSKSSFVSKFDTFLLKRLLTLDTRVFCSFEKLSEKLVVSLFLSESIERRN